MIWHVTSHVGAGPLRFGMTRAETHALLGGPSSTTEKGASSAGPTDIYGDTAVFVYYDADDRIRAIEFWRDDDHIIEVEGERLVGRTYRDALGWVLARDPHVEEEDAGLTSRELGVALYADGARKDPDSEVESLLVFRRGYYEENSAASE